ncbi:hypothetical protein AM231_17060 [Paenibacillus solani]|uniref:Uncharacterized protein n=1 Tax=Paenibacillus solani TaxID=1705565 RepID=A0A0M1P018_9BACL|nr:hypothetical protein AM231_17060 [Paenibacillus solani]
MKLLRWIVLTPVLLLLGIVVIINISPYPFIYWFRHQPGPVQRGGLLRKRTFRRALFPGAFESLCWRLDSCGGKTWLVRRSEIMGIYLRKKQ